MIAFVCVLTNENWLVLYKFVRTQTLAIRTNHSGIQGNHFGVKGNHLGKE